jgi:drug/metabolite transporter (DMT)-like permease
MSLLFALLAAVGWGSSDFAAGHASRRSSAVSVVVLTHLASVFALLGVTFFPGQSGSPTGSDLLWGLAAGVAGGLGAMLLFRGLGRGSMSVVAPITATGAAMIPVAAGVLQGESLSGLGFAGIVLALVAIVMVSLTAEQAVVAPDVELVAAGAGAWSPPSGQPIQHAAPPSINAHPTWPAPRSAGDAAPWGSAGLPLRRVRVIVLTLLAAAVLASGGIAAIPVAAMSSGDEFSLGHTLTLLFALSILGLVSIALNLAKPLFELIDAGRGERTAVDGLGFREVLRRPGLVDALLSGIGFGLFFVFIAQAGEDGGHWPLVAARFISVVMFAAGAIVTSTAVLPDRPSRPAVVLAGLLDAAAAVLFVLSTRDGLLSVGAVLASLYPAVTVLLARFVTKERITRPQLIGLALAGVAVSLIALR